MEGITYKLEKFEGPLDLLLNLIHKNKVQIEDIPISLICDQYIEYIARAQELDIELAVEFLSMASELMLIKSRMLLPREVPEEEDPRARLAEAIARLEAAKKAAAKLGEKIQAILRTYGEGHRRNIGGQNICCGSGPRQAV